MREQVFVMESELAEKKKALTAEKELTQEAELKSGRDISQVLDKVFLYFFTLFNSKMRGLGGSVMTINNFLTRLEIKHSPDTSSIELLQRIKQQLVDTSDIIKEFPAWQQQQQASLSPQPATSPPT